MDTQTIVERIERARTESMKCEQVSEDPLVYSVENEDGTSETSIHTVVPEAVHCSCADNVYRESICKHLAFVALETDTDVLTDALESERESLRAEATKLEEKHSAVVSELDELNDVIDELDDSVPTVSEIIGDGSESEFDLMVDDLVDSHQ